MAAMAMLAAACSGPKTPAEKYIRLLEEGTERMEKAGSRDEVNKINLDVAKRSAEIAEEARRDTVAMTPDVVDRLRQAELDYNAATADATLRNLN